MRATTLSDLIKPAPEPSELDWNQDGFVIHKGVLPEDLMSAYEREWWAYNGSDIVDESEMATGLGSTLMGEISRRPGGWPDATPYMRHEALRNLATCPEVMEPMIELVGEPMGLHLNLTGWVSTERDWHQDTYLNPPNVGAYYAAVWMALDDVHPDSGPFQMVPGSHRWFELTRQQMWDALGAEVVQRDDWPTRSEGILTPLLQQEIDVRVLTGGARIVDYLPKRGDVLFWHSRLIHRGSKANVSGMTRRALICHYSGIHHRQDMAKAHPVSNVGWIFPLVSTTKVS